MNEKIKVTVAERTFLLTSSDEESYVQKVAESVDEQIRQAAEASHASTLDAAIMCAMNLADNFFKEQEKSEHLRQQVKQYLDEANQMKQEAVRSQAGDLPPPAGREVTLPSATRTNPHSAPREHCALWG